MAAKNAPLDFEGLPPGDIANMLRRFYGEVRQRNGKPYGTSAMRNLRQSIQRHLSDPPYKRKLSIICGIDFKDANEIFDSELRKLRLKGLDEAKHKESIEPADMTKFMCEVSIDNPAGLQEAMFVSFMTHFGRRGREGLRQLKKDSIRFGIKDNIEFAEIRYNEATKCDDGTKKAQCGPVSKETLKKMWAEPGDEMCPVKILQTYISKLNPDCEALFQRPNHSFKRPQDRWYDNMVLGVKFIGGMMRTISEKYHLSTAYTNHCLRATVVTELDRAGFESKDICYATGHRSTESLKHYCDKPSTNTSLEMSRALHRYLNQKQVGPGGYAPALAPALAPGLAPALAPAAGHAPIRAQAPAPAHVPPRAQDPAPAPAPVRAQAPAPAPVFAQIPVPALAQAPDLAQSHAPAPASGLGPSLTPAPVQASTSQNRAQELNINTSEQVLHMLQGFLNNPVFHSNVTINVNINK